MTKLSMILFVVYCVFLNIGGVIFMNLEWETVESINILEEGKWTTLKEIISRPNPPDDEDNLTNLLKWLLDKCPHLPDNISLLIKTPGNHSHVTSDILGKCPELYFEVTEIKYNYPWNFIDALYFSMTVVTTIGYGHVSPTNTLGRIVCMMYAIVGIPLTMLLLTWTSNFFGERLFRLFEAKLDKEKQVSRFFIALGTVFYIFVGFLIFIFLPAVVFMHTEDWTYLEGVYFAFITLTTIGFGDLVTGKSMEGHWMYVYQIAVIVWIISGLGYWVMVANFITRALKSKKMQTFAKRATDIKKLMTQVGLTHHDPKFLPQRSKTTLNLMLQLSNALAMPELAQNNGKSNNNGPSSPQTPPLIPGITSLFGNPGLGGMIAFMAPSTAKAKPQSRVPSKEPGSTTDSTLDVQEEETANKANEARGKSSEGKGEIFLRQRTVDADIEQRTREPSIVSLPSDHVISINAKSSVEPSTCTTEASSMKSLLSSPSSPGSGALQKLNAEIIEAFNKDGFEIEDVVDALKLEEGLAFKYSHSLSSSTQSKPNDESQDTQENESFSIRL